ncbi:zinc finger, CCHC-type containing protein [Tanacetum coccineum]
MMSSMAMCKKNSQMNEVEFLKLFEEEIEVRLNYRDQMRRWEMYVNGRPLGPRREHPEIFDALGRLLGLLKIKGSIDQIGSQYSYCFSIEEDPKTYNEAMQSQDATFWKEAIDDELFYYEKYTLVHLIYLLVATFRFTNGSFKRKMKVDGTINKFKARLVIQGFRQKEGIDYFNTYALVARITIIRLFVALAAIHNLVIHQMDVKIAFLNGDLNKEVYISNQKDLLCQKLIQDSIWINHVEDSFSTSGWVFLLGGGTISWAYKKQTCITGLTMESEFVALDAVGKDAKWLRTLMQ